MRKEKIVRILNDISIELGIFSLFGYFVGTIMCPSLFSSSYGRLKIFLLFTILPGGAAIIVGIIAKHLKKIYKLEVSTKLANIGILLGFIHFPQLIRWLIK